MPRTGGVYSPPAGTKGVSNTTIQSVPYNAFVDDLTDDANAARPVTAGGTGATTATGARTNLGVAIGSDVQAYDAGLASIAGLTTSADKMIYTTASDAYATTALTSFARTILDDADAAAVRTTISAQASDAGLTSIAGLTTAADRMIYTTALDTYAVATLTSFARTLLDDADATTARATLGVTIGTNVQAYDAALAAISGLAFTDGGFIVGNGTTYVIESGATARASMGVPATTLTLTAGNGLTGGGDLAANRTFTLGTPSDITNSTTNSVTSTSHTHALGFIAAEVSTTTSNSTTSFPLGHVILCLVTATNRNGTAVPALYNGDTIQYVYDGYPSGGGSGAVLSGTWRARGNVGADGRYLLQKVA
ncbi:hypothetical protein SFHH103_00150 [Sinorhizobium fredii HH103]|uniref:Uncharacterized protein n=1 Tax=Sinorhizobium fredii (strain HH103) TaxID=1117943 RepID=G9AA63_SINF1|nr:hypothetical protein [Sinorhizobium fredii]CCE94654.1 hypothetical protein SFHH103_00150 [Sinorhizobium fredii HH103]